MSWLASFFVAVLTAIAGAFVSGFCASLAVDWYRVSSFEGGSGYFVVGLALMGCIGAFIVGLIVARSVAGSPNPGFARSLGTALGVVLVLNGAVAGVARILADVPPEIDGQQLLIAFEMKWPESERTDPRTLTGIPHAALGSSSGGTVRTVRKSEEGVLLVDDAHLDDGRWIVPGAVRIFTTRGKPLLLTNIGEKSLGGFLLPLAAHPTSKDREWSEWMPHPRPGAAPLPDGFRVRYRVIKISEPFREQHVGPFTVATIARYFYHNGMTSPVSVNGLVNLAFRGKAIEGMQGVRVVDVVSGTGSKTALLVAGDSTWEGKTNCVLLVADGDSLSRVDGGSCPNSLDARLVTNDPQRLAEQRAKPDAPGWLDVTTLKTPGLYRLDSSMLDTRTLSVTPFAFPPDTYPPDPPGLIALSPDEHSVVWFQQEPPALGVTNYVAKRSYVVPIDRARMRYGAHEHLDPPWVDHHFAWVRAADGDSLAPRPTFTPLPYRGDLTTAKPGEYQSWTLMPGSEALRDLVIETMVKEMHAELLPQSVTTVTRQLRIDGKSADVFLNDSTYVNVSMSGADSDPLLLQRIAKVLDAELATGKHDRLFARQPEK